jgi:hypothetical protein
MSHSILRSHNLTRTIPFSPLPSTLVGLVNFNLLHYILSLLLFSKTHLKKPISRMLKAELQQLCQHFCIPVEGNVLDLRKRLNAYLKAHENDLRNNRNYAALFPQRRGRNRQQASTPSDSDSGQSSESDNNNYPAWNGVIDAEEIIQIAPSIHSPTPEPTLNGAGDEENDNMDLVGYPSLSPEPQHQPRLQAQGHRHQSHSATQSSG